MDIGRCSRFSFGCTLFYDPFLSLHWTSICTGLLAFYDIIYLHPYYIVGRYLTLIQHEL